MSSLAVRHPRAAFSIVELIAVIVCFAVLSGIAIPRFAFYSDRRRDQACHGSLEGVRAGIQHFHANSAQEGSKPRFPTLQELRTPGVVIVDRIPPNPFVADRNIAAVVLPGQYRGGETPAFEETPTGGWRYDAASGHFWANTASRTKSPRGTENTW
jgi:type II secretory pathway pseudopilin PulG